MRLVSVILVSALLLSWTPDARGDVAGSKDPGWSEPKAAESFAALDRNGQPYPAFYRLYIRPHAVLEQGTVWCAHQDGEGHLHIFFGCHGRAMHHVKSLRPHDLTAWKPMPHPTGRATYPQTMRMAAAYCTFHPGADNQTVHCFFVHKDDNPTRVEPHPWRPLKYPGLHEAVYRYNIYYLMRDAEGTWRAGDGTALPLPLSKATADRLALVRDTGHEFARPRRVVIDGDNRPYIRFQEGVSDWTSGRVVVPLKARYATLRNGRWQVTSEVSDGWPLDAQRLVNTPGDPVAGVLRPSRWFIFEKRGLADRGRASYVFLYHLKDGYAVRDDGPAWPPVNAAGASGTGRKR